MKSSPTFASRSYSHEGSFRSARVFPFRITGILVTLLLAAGLAPTTLAQQRVRSELSFPDIPGYVTLKCDFHAHTVFSDGNLWPPTRVEEAWHEGYDVLAITDHLEHQVHRQDMPGTNHNRSYELARPTAESLGLLLIHAAELTRGEPPGHWNLLFITNANAIPLNDHRAALRAAREQGAFVFWNHPGWKQPERKAKWYDEQQEAFTNGWLNGIEILNGPDYEAIAHQWCLEKKLTCVGNSDLHTLSTIDFGFPPNSRRPITLVFAREKSIPAIKEALLDRRTAVFGQNMLYGEARFLRPLFDASVVVRSPELNIAPKARATLQLHNRSTVNFELEANGKVATVNFPDKVTLFAGQTVALELQRTAAELESGARIELPYRVTNLKTAPEEPMAVQIPFKVSSKRERK